jgi:hypothetical protein
MMFPGACTEQVRPLMLSDTICRSNPFYGFNRSNL